MLRTLIYLIAFILGLFLAFPGQVTAQIERLPSHVKVDEQTLPSCYEGSTGNLVGSRTSRTRVLVSPEGRYRAYAENEAVAFKVSEHDPKRKLWIDCANTSRLFVVGPGDKAFRPVLILEPVPQRLGNSLGLVDWSPDSRYLLLGVGFWQWASDYFEGQTRLYEAEYGVFTEMSLPY